MRSLLIVAATVLAVASSGAQAQTDLTAYADRQGYIDVQALNCAALAATWQEDADRLTTWYSGWYNGKEALLQHCPVKGVGACNHCLLQSASGNSNHRSDRCDAQAREASGRFQMKQQKTSRLGLALSIVSTSDGEC